eukprot:14800-Heterococcus_DN1.PRE.1
MHAAAVCSAMYNTANAAQLNKHMRAQYKQCCSVCGETVLVIVRYTILSFARLTVPTTTPQTMLLYVRFHRMHSQRPNKI